MKKIYALIIFFVLLSSTIFGAVATTVNIERDKIKITETVLYGNKSVAEGLEITSRNCLNYRLFWDTDYTIGHNPLTHTKYSFYSTPYYGEHRKQRYEGVISNNNIDQYVLFDTDLSTSEQEGIQKAYKELFDSAENGQEKRKTVYLKDYYDYYPISFSFDLPHTNWTGYESGYGDVLEGKPYDARYVTEKFREYFKIPVLDSDTVNIGVIKSDDSHYTTSIDVNDSFDFFTISTVAESKNRCFFSIRKYQNKEYDTSFIPGGYGIYSFYYNGGDSASRTGIIADKLETVYSLSQETIVKYISLNDDETELLLFTIENGFSYLTVIDIETMTEIYKFLIDDCYLDFVYEYDDFIVVDMGDSISVISVKNNIYSLEYNVQKASFINEEFQEWYINGMDYKDGKLALVGNYFSEEGYVSCDFFVSVYNKNGLIYYGIYDNSLDFNRLTHEYRLNCHPDDITPNRIKWN